MVDKRFLGRHASAFRAFELFKYIGPGFLVTVGFIDPGNWAANMAAGSQYGYSLLWIVTLSTLMLILLQHNAAHLGIVTGLCLSEACTKYFRNWVNKLLLLSALGASISTALAEILGTAIGLNMLLGLPLSIGAFLFLIEKSKNIPRTQKRRAESKVAPLNALYRIAPFHAVVPA